jgi:hypothetical protein
MESDNVSELLTASELGMEMRFVSLASIINTFVPCSPSAISPGAASYLAEGLGAQVQQTRDD